MIFLHSHTRAITLTLVILGAVVLLGFLFHSTLFAVFRYLGKRREAARIAQGIIFVSKANGVNELMSSKPQKNVEHFNKWAATYEKSAAQRWYFGPIHLAMLDLLEHERSKEPPRSILDIGCGTGRLLRAASVRWPHAQLSGADPAELMVSEARRLNPSAIFEQAFSESLPFPDQSFDLVLSSLSFHHWENQAEGLKEIARVLCPGGWFCLADHAIPGWITSLCGEKSKSLNQIRGLIQAAGLTVICQKRLWLRLSQITLACK